MIVGFGLFGGIAVLGLIFLGIDRIANPDLKRWGPWLVAVGLCVAACVAFPPMRREVHDWRGLLRYDSLQDIAIGFGLLLLFAGEGVLIAQWLKRSARKALQFVFLYTCATFTVWLVTFLVVSAILPIS